MEWAWGLVVTGVAIPAVTGAFSWYTRAQVSELRTSVQVQFADARTERVSQLAELRAASLKYTDDNRRVLEMSAIAASEDHKDFQIRVLNEFVKEKSLRDTEERLMRMLGNLEAKIDKLAERNGHQNGHS